MANYYSTVWLHEYFISYIAKHRWKSLMDEIGSSCTGCTLRQENKPEFYKITFLSVITGAFLKWV